MSRRSYSSTPSLLPLSTSDTSNGDNVRFVSRIRPEGVPRITNSQNSFTSNRGLRIPTTLRRILRPPTLDFETAIWEMWFIFKDPHKVYKSLFYQKQTKNTWARDDPSFMILLSALLSISAIAWGLAYSPSILAILRLIVYMVLVDFLAIGIVVASAYWFFVNRFLKHKNTGTTMSMGVDEELEWAYCFDVHCNSFLYIWVFLYVVQLFFLPLLNGSGWLSLFIGNTIYLCALCGYFSITFMGYRNIPYIEHCELLLFPVIVSSILYFISLFGFNISRTMVHLYFG